MSRHTFPKEGTKKLKETIKMLKSEIRSLESENRILREELINIVKPNRTRKSNVEQPKPQSDFDGWKRDFMKRLKADKESK